MELNIDDSMLKCLGPSGQICLLASHDFGALVLQRLRKNDQRATMKWNVAKTLCQNA